MENPFEILNAKLDKILLELENLKKEEPLIVDETVLLTRAEAAEFLKINSTTLWSWTNKGKVKAYGIGARRYYKKDELMESLVQVKN